MSLWQSYMATFSMNVLVNFSTMGNYLDLQCDFESNLWMRLNPVIIDLCPPHCSTKVSLYIPLERARVSPRVLLYTSREQRCFVLTLMIASGEHAGSDTFSHGNCACQDPTGSPVFFFSNRTTPRKKKFNVYNVSTGRRRDSQGGIFRLLKRSPWESLVLR